MFCPCAQSGSAYHGPWCVEKHALNIYARDGDSGGGAGWEDGGSAIGVGNLGIDEEPALTRALDTSLALLTTPKFTSKHSVVQRSIESLIRMDAFG